jgi:plastocyanin
MVSALRAEAVMQLDVSLRSALVLVCAGTIWGCGDTRSQLSPTSPSSIASQTSPRDRSEPANTVPRRIDSDGDGYEDPAMPDPGSVPAPVPGEVPPPQSVVVPVQLTINIVGTFGAAAFAPNPLQAAVENTIVWSNGDLIVHDIVLDDGTPIGTLAPGQSSVPISVTAPTMGYRCTFHPSMVGQVTTMLPGAPVPSDPSQSPVPDPGYSPPPASDPYGDGPEDSYDDYY